MVCCSSGRSTHRPCWERTPVSMSDIGRETRELFRNTDCRDTYFHQYPRLRWFCIPCVMHQTQGPCHVSTAFKTVRLFSGEQVIILLYEGMSEGVLDKDLPIVITGKEPAAEATSCPNQPCTNCLLVGFPYTLGTIAKIGRCPPILPA